MKHIEATILGQSYKLACPPDGEALLRDAVVIVDREMCAIRDAGRMKARERIAVLTALNLAYLQVEQGLGGRTQPATSAPTQRSASAAGEAAHTHDEASSAARIEALIQRIDGVLGDDGLLL